MIHSKNCSFICIFFHPFKCTPRPRHRRHHGSTPVPGPPWKSLCSCGASDHRPTGPSCQGTECRSLPFPPCWCWSAPPPVNLASAFCVLTACSGVSVTALMFCLPGISIQLMSLICLLPTPLMVPGPDCAQGCTMMPIKVSGSIQSSYTGTFN